MSATMQLEKLSNVTVDAIVNLVNATDGPVTLLKVEREISGFAENWYIGRQPSDSEPIRETIVEVFGQAPICTHTACEAMLFAAACHASFLHISMGAQWARID